MAHLLNSLLLLLFLLLPSAHGSSPHTRSTAQPGPNTPSLPGPAREFLDAHNQARAQVGVGPLKWSVALANATARLATYQRVKSNCQFADTSSIKYGANQLMARGMAVGPRAAVSAWVAEKKYYSRKGDTCTPNHQCGVYKQVVWRKSVELGCAQASCVKDGSSLTVCFYNPPGNVVGESPY